jgi:hypothetical protein
VLPAYCALLVVSVFRGPLPEHMSEEKLVGFFSFVVGLEIISFASYQVTDQVMSAAMIFARYADLSRKYKRFAWHGVTVLAVLQGL